MSAEREPRLKRLGLDASPVPFLPDTWYHCRRFFLRDGFASESLNGQSVAPVMGTLPDRDVGVLAVVTLPNFLLEISNDSAMAMRLSPVSPQCTQMQMQWLVRQDAVEGVDFHVENVMGFWRMTAEQDWKLCEDNQAGVNSSRYLPGPYAPDERGLEHFVQWYWKQTPIGGRII